MFIPLIGSQVNNNAINQNFKRLQSRVDSGVIRNDTVRVATSKTPASASDTGATGQIAWDSDYIYVCVDTDTWKRVAIATW